MRDLSFLSGVPDAPPFFSSDVADRDPPRTIQLRAVVDASETRVESRPFVVLDRVTDHLLDRELYNSLWREVQADEDAYWAAQAEIETKRLKKVASRKAEFCQLVLITAVSTVFWVGVLACLK